MMISNLTEEYERACKYGNSVTKEALDDAVSMFKVLFSKHQSKQHLVLVKGLLNRMTSGLPLSPITMEDFDNTVASEIRGELKHTCARYEALTATKKSEGTEFTYSDSKRVVFYDQSLINQEETSSIVDILHSRANYPSIALKLVDDLFPITLPYMPGDTYEVFGSSYSFKLAKGGEPDLVEIDFIKTPNGQLVKVDQYYRKTRDGKYVEVDLENFKHYRTFGAVDLNYKWIRCLINVEGPEQERRRVNYFAAKDIVEEGNGELSGVVVGHISYTEANAPYETEKVIDSFEVFPLVNQYTVSSTRQPLYIREIDKIVSDDEIMQLIETGKMCPKFEEADVRPVLKTMFGAMNKYFAEHRA
jgi:hypothetical protein